MSAQAEVNDKITKNISSGEGELVMHKVQRSSPTMRLSGRLSSLSLGGKLMGGPLQPLVRRCLRCIIQCFIRLFGK
jgi:hypothetical protein